MEHALTGKEELFMAIDDGKNHTVDEILALPDGERAELLDGEMFMMATPTTTHQAILNWINLEIYNDIRNKRGKCMVLPAPYGIFLKNDNKNYVEPDIVVICNRDKVDNMGCHGAPDWILEIVSPSSKIMDYHRKLEAYRAAGVREYWIVDPDKKSVTVYDLENSANPSLYRFTEKVSSKVIEGFELDFNEAEDYIFA